MMLKVLFVCTMNKYRSATAEEVFSAHSGLDVKSAGTHPEARVPLTLELLEWADVVFVMESSHLAKVCKKSKGGLRGKRVYNLNIPDDFEYMEEGLVTLLQMRAAPFLPEWRNDSGEYLTKENQA